MEWNFDGLVDELGVRYAEVAEQGDGHDEAVARGEDDGEQAGGQEQEGDEAGEGNGGNLVDEEGDEESVVSVHFRNLTLAVRPTWELRRPWESFDEALQRLRGSGPYRSPWTRRGGVSE